MSPDSFSFPLMLIDAHWAAHIGRDKCNIFFYNHNIDLVLACAYSQFLVTLLFLYGSSEWRRPIGAKKPFV